MSHERGQATIDYVALIAVLALLLASAAAVAGLRGVGVADAVLGQLRRALCIVTGGACPADRRPCVVASRRDEQHVAAMILLARLDGDRYVLRERLSDGSWRLTLVHRGGLGVEAAEGAGLLLRMKGRLFGLGRQANLGGQGVVGYGEVYVARDDEEADAILRTIARSGPRIGRGGPPAREVVVEGGTRGLARIGTGGLIGGESVEGVSEQMLGARRDRVTGETTVTWSAGANAWAMVYELMTGPRGSLDRELAFTLRFDRRGRPVELSLTASGTVAAGIALPPGLAGPLGVDGGAMYSTAGRRWELAASLDLRDPQLAAAWAAVRRDPADAGAIRELGVRLRTQGQLDVRSYAVRFETDGSGGRLSAGPQLGGELEWTTERARLLAAATRPPGGVWERDCRAA